MSAPIHLAGWYVSVSEYALAAMQDASTVRRLCASGQLDAVLTAGLWLIRVGTGGALPVDWQEAARGVASVTHITPNGRRAGDRRPAVEPRDAMPDDVADITMDRHREGQW